VEAARTRAQKHDDKERQARQNWRSNTKVQIPYW